MLHKILSIIIMVVLVCGLAFAENEGAKAKSAKETTLDKGTREQIGLSVERGIQFLFQSQGKDGSWYNHVGISAICIKAIMESPFREKYKNDPRLQNAVKFLIASVKKDGGIYVKDMPNYNTSIAIMALDSLKDKKYHKYIVNAQNFLMNLQNREELGFNKEDDTFGGIGYGSTLRADLSNLQLALEALSVDVPGADNSKKREAFKRALVFLQRVQQPDGGAAYRPNDEDNPAGVERDAYGRVIGLRSYGSMTYAMFKSYIYAGLKNDDPRVKAALNWLQSHYTVEENPNMGKKGLYYYLHTFSKALSAAKIDFITDNKGVRHNWRMDLAKKLLADQGKDGSWVNEKDRWMENNKVLVTSYVLLCLGYSMQ